MKNAWLLVGGLCAAVAAFVVVQSKRQRPLKELAHDLEAAWADHHTVA